MKKLKNVFEFHVFLSLLFFTPIISQSQNFGQFASAIIMDTNVVNPNDGPQGIQDWFCLTQCDPNNPNTIFVNSTELNGANFGNRIQFTNSLQLDGAEIKTFKNPGANVCGIDIYYRFYLSSSTPPTFQTVSVNTVKAECSGGVFTDGLGPCSGNDQKWQVGESFPGSVSPFNIDLTGVCAGTYFLEVYFVIRGSNSSPSACNEQVIINNNGNNFIATYSIESFLTANISAVVPTCAEGVIQLQANAIQKSHPGEVSFAWSGPNNFTNTDQNPFIPAIMEANGIYNCVITDPCGLTFTGTVEVLVNPLPQVPVSGGNLEVCESIPINPITATASNTDGSDIVWYDAPTGGNVVGNPVLSNIGAITYYAEGIFTSTGCISPSRTPVTLTILPAPNVPTSNGDITICETNPIQPITAIATSTTGNQVVWYDAPSGGNVVTNPSLSTIGTVTYYAASQNATSLCESLSRTAVTLSILQAPNAPSGDLTQTFCSSSNPTISNLIASGNNIQWFDSPNSTVALPPSLVLQNNTTYYASQTIDGCESIERLAILVSIQDIISPTFDFPNNLTFCSGDSVPSLPNTSNNGITGTWSPSSINNTQNGSYVFTPNAGSCANAISLQVIITPVENPTFDFGNQLSICQGSVVPSLPTTSNNGITGTWSPSSFNYTQSGNYVFTPSNNCAASFALNVEIIPTFDFEIGWRCSGKKFELFATDFSGNISANQANFSWSFQNTTVGNNQSVLNVTDIIGATRPVGFPLVYQLTVTNNQGCSLTKTYEVTAIYCDIPKGISPNGDGLNDFFDLQLLEVNHLSIFNRWGVKVYEKQNYTKEWVGQSDNGSELPDATYFYHIRFKSGEEKTGWVYVNRESR